jgi:hypothetical protein
MTILPEKQLKGLNKCRIVSEYDRKNEKEMGTD